MGDDEAMTLAKLQEMFPDSLCSYSITEGAHIVGDGFTIDDFDEDTRFHTLKVGARSIDSGLVVDLWREYFGPHGGLLPRYADMATPIQSPPAPPEVPTGPTGQELLSIDEYHAHPALGSTTVKRALTHPERMSAPSGINPKAAEFGHRMHCAVIEPEEMHRRYCVAPSPDDYPNALRTATDLREALKSAGIKGYSGKKSAELVTMVRESIPGAQLWSDILSRHGADAEGKTFVSSDEWDEMHRVADAVMAHPVIQAEGIFTDGVGEASFFSDVAYDTPSLYGRKWPMKARPDWLQMGRRVVDLKTWAGGKPVESFYADANKYHYDLSAALYLDVLRQHGHTSDVFTWVVVDKSTAKTGGRVIVHVATMSSAFLAQGREKLAVALERINDWEAAPEIYDRQTQVEHIAEPPAWGWR